MSAGSNGQLLVAKRMFGSCCMFGFGNWSTRRRSWRLLGIVGGGVDGSDDAWLSDLEVRSYLGTDLVGWYGEMVRDRLNLAEKSGWREIKGCEGGWGRGTGEILLSALPRPFSSFGQSRAGQRSGYIMGSVGRRDRCKGKKIFLTLAGSKPKIFWEIYINSNVPSSYYWGYFAYWQVCEVVQLAVRCGAP